jgi:excisionase family DNA binding protein
MDPSRRLGSAKEACEIAGCSPGTLRNWLHQKLISAVRVGPRGRFLYDLDDVAAMRVEYGKTADDRIRELVDAAPQPTPEQINKIRLLPRGDWRW